MIDFTKCFELLTGNMPFAWQIQLYKKFLANEIPSACDIPTGLGKTSVIVIWLLALAAKMIENPQKNKIPRRLVYVVDRRVIVDQATQDAVDIFENLNNLKDSSNEIRQIYNALVDASFISDNISRTEKKLEENVIEISTLRGEYADNSKWFLDPSRPAIIVGTIDMIGSRLLFSGYGKIGKSYKALQAGLLGQDSLIVTDEAHLSPAFIALLGNLQPQIYQTDKVKKVQIIKPLKLMQLSATLNNRADETKNSETKTEVFRVDETDEDLKDENSKVSRRFYADKSIFLREFEVEAEKLKGTSALKNFREAKVNAIVEKAAQYANDSAAIVIYAKEVETVKAISKILGEKLQEIYPKENRILTMTGGMRGKERDEITKNDGNEQNEVFKKFIPQENRENPDGIWYLVATSTAEVGINLDADHAICDLTSLDSLIQRIGRVNRFGNGKAEIMVVFNPQQIEATKNYFDALEKLEKLSEAVEQIDRLKQEAQKNEKKQIGEELKEAKKSFKDFADKDLKKIEKIYVRPLALDEAEFFTFQKLRENELDGKIDASPFSLKKISDDLRCYPIPPVCPPLDSARIDDWAMTSVSGKDFPRPQVASWLRGVIDDETSETRFCWRADLKFAATDKDGNVIEEDALKMIETVPISTRETARETTSRAVTLMKILISKAEEKDFFVLIDSSGEDEVHFFSKFNNKKSLDNLFTFLAFKTIVLPCEIGGLKKGLIIGDMKDLIIGKTKKPEKVEDVAENFAAGNNVKTWLRLVFEPHENGWTAKSLVNDEKVYEEPKSIDKLIDEIEKEERKICVHQSRNIKTDKDDEADEIEDIAVDKKKKPLPFVAYFVNPKSPEKLFGEEDVPSKSIGEVALEIHNADVEDYARRLSEKLCLDADLIEALAIAGKWHDAGKNRAGWQKAIGNFDSSKPLAKSGKNRFIHSYSKGYRHEFGSIIEAEASDEVKNHPHRDLILHLIAAHHGWARPHFPERAFDPNQTKPFSRRKANEAMKRFAKLQNEYGWWQLAYLEAILKAADAMASRDRMGE